MVTPIGKNQCLFVVELRPKWCRYGFSGDRFRGVVMASQNDMKMAEETYSTFIGLVKWGTILSAIVAAVVILVIS